MALTPLPWSAQDAQPAVASLATPRAKTIAAHASNQLSVWCAAQQKMSITVLGHPFRACKVTLPSKLGAFGLAIRIDVQNDLCDFSPICSFGVRIKETQIRNKMLFIVAGEYRLRRSSIRYGRIEWRLGHGVARSEFNLHDCISSKDRRSEMTPAPPIHDKASLRTFAN